jgi:hypothetical protein
VIELFLVRCGDASVGDAPIKRGPNRPKEGPKKVTFQLEARSGPLTWRRASVPIAAK